MIAERRGVETGGLFAPTARLLRSPGGGFTMAASLKAGFSPRGAS